MDEYAKEHKVLTTLLGLVVIGMLVLDILNTVGIIHGEANYLLTFNTIFVFLAYIVESRKLQIIFSTIALIFIIVHIIITH
ncbi:hypothetical protein [Staphylococcus massiliensis]|uniref:Uncharacterized protein n=1 Tax=Staphylococcus massiliensis S46 TaxID=1229783 RepID=K9B4V5_9STAP|nr:hypothetical protein [Staphylococcus massiliensis]EKU49837.1 hypothetical protein C273_03045 [Staphylococcus massiliensis S46]MCG3398942.1 hypothetical protein [Staphylococcus massiliensis]MCG3412991.1 hypothetical protein [Staphylococcus massiliensis]POA02071.1 hypothetical protein CD133_00275 [Staphylococcus massiliensis CCUG 55927]